MPEITVIVSKFPPPLSGTNKIKIKKTITNIISNPIIKNNGDLLDVLIYYYFAVRAF
jgi:hypothetical protein